MIRRVALLVGLAVATPAFAQDREPRFCPSRPSLGESGCTTEPGHVQLELSTIDWTLDRTPDAREDTVLVGDVQARFGITPMGELQVGWTAYGHVRTRDRLSGAVEHGSGVGDVQIGWRQNLRNPDGSGLSLAVEPSVTLPVGGEAIGDGTWSAGLVLPVTYDVTDQLNLALTNEVDAQANESGRGRHLTIVETVGLGYDVSDQVTAVAELQLTQDQQPMSHTTQALAAGSLAWQPRHGLQVDVLVAGGLNRDTPDVRVLTGGAILF